MAIQNKNLLVLSPLFETFFTYLERLDADVEAQEVHGFPNRSPSPHCVSGSGVSTQYRRRNFGEDQVEVVTVAADCRCLRNALGEEFIAVLAMKDTETRLLSEHAVR